MNDIDFIITRLNRVIRRKPNLHWHNNRLFYESEYNMVIVLGGKSRYIINSEEILLKKNDVIIFPPGIVRAGYADKIDPWEFITINFNLELNENGKEFFDKEYLLFSNTGTSILGKFLDIAYLWEGKNPLFAVKCKALISDILYELIRNSLPHSKILHSEKLEAARTYIQANFREKLSIEALAERMELSVSYFRKLFTRAYGQSPQQYIMSLRINTAYDLLESGEVNVSEAAILSGFDDIYYFSTLFKKQTGLSPSHVLHKNNNDV